MNKLCLGLLALGLSCNILAAQTTVTYNCTFTANKDKFTKEQHEKIDQFIASRERATVAQLVRALGGSAEDVKESVANVKAVADNFSVNPKMAKIKSAKFTVSGNCKVDYKAKQAFGVDIERDRVFSKVLTQLSHRDILAIEDYIADLADYRTPVDRSVRVDSDLVYQDAS